MKLFTMAVEQRYIEEALAFISEKKKVDSNEEYLKNVSLFLMKLLNVDYVFVNSYSIKKANKTETIVACCQGVFVPNVSYDLDGTPCHNVIDASLCVYPKDVQQLFPKDKLLVDMGVESYVGIPLWGNAGDPIGLLAILDSKPIEDSESIQMVLKIVATRVAHVLENVIDNKCLKDSLSLLNKTEHFANLGSWTWDLSSDFTVWSDELYNILGVDSKSFITSLSNSYAVVHPADFESQKQIFEELLVQGGTKKHELRVIRPNGIVRHLQSWTSLIKDAYGGSQSIRSTVIDITEVTEAKKMLEGLGEVQATFIEEDDSKTSFNKLLEVLLVITGSEYGFIGEVLEDENNSPYLKTHAITDISWNKETTDFYKQHAPQGLEFKNLKTLFGEVIVTGKTVISNSPYTDHRRGGLPEGHPYMASFMGVPFYKSNKLVGVFGVANRPGGYFESDVEKMMPILNTCSTLIVAQANIRRQKITQQELLESETQKKVLFDTALDAIISIDTNHKIIMLNQSAAKMFDYKVDDLLGKPFSLLVPEDSVKILMDGYDEDAFVRLMSKEAVIYGVTSKGKRIPIEASLSKQEVNGSFLYNAFIRDVSGRIEAERQIKESEEKFRNFTESSKVAIFVIKEDKFYYSNRETSELSGYAPDELFGMSFYDILDLKYVGILTRKLERIAEYKNGHLRLDVNIVSKLGVEKTIDLSVAIIEIEGESSFLVSAIDVSKQYEMTHQINKSIDLLQRKNQELEEFAYITSHDLQEPLNTIGSFVELLEQDYKAQLDDNAIQYLDYITQSSSRLKLLIKGLLEYSRIGGDVLVETVDCNEILRQVKEDFQLVIKNKNAEILSEKLPVLQGYPIEMKQLFQNLLSNSLKYSKEGVVPVIKITSDKRDEDWLFSFEDNGIGIDNKFKEKIFVIFQRLHNKDDYEGTGIGLANCRKIVELHNGKIWFDSVKDQGTKFFFTIKDK